ncbi:hypothetical protein ACFSL6_25040 [Paenibacillus thailandensis]|uniref:DUF5590 domain-containing protein n=1 Tax=Paenibacillus thailandensis TaxID=393250 RepID=A0ABW5R2R3_9BACL
MTQVQKKNKNVLGLVNAVITGCLVVVVIALVILYQNTKEQVTLMAQTVSSVTETNRQNTNTIAYLENSLGYVQFARSTEGGDVTQQLIVEKFTVTSLDPLKFTIDVINQPTNALKYEGNGIFSMEDRDVKAMASGIIEQVKERYDSWSNLKKWDDNTEVTLTIQNYEIGTYKAGKFTLKGE